MVSNQKGLKRKPCKAEATCERWVSDNCLAMSSGLSSILFKSISTIQKRFTEIQQAELILLVCHLDSFLFFSQFLYISGGLRSSGFAGRPDIRLHTIQVQETILIYRH